MATGIVGLAAVGLLSGCSTTTYTVIPTPGASAPSATASASPSLAAAATPPGQLLNGVYTTMVGPIQAQWTINSTCAAEACTATISSSNGGWTGNAALTDGRWDITVVRPDGVTCRNGTSKPATNHYSWDAVTLVGTVDSAHDAVCAGEPASVFHDTFTIVTPPISTTS